MADITITNADIQAIISGVEIPSDPPKAMAGQPVRTKNVICDAIDVVIPILKQLAEKANAWIKLVIMVVIGLLEAYKKANCAT
jgi:hypothetical protein